MYMSDTDAVSEATLTILRRAADTQLSIAFLQLVCAPEGLDLDMGIAELVNDASTESKKAMIDQLQRVGAIRFVGGRWTATDKGRQINERLALRPERR